MAMEFRWIWSDSRGMGCMRKFFSTGCPWQHSIGEQIDTE